MSETIPSGIRLKNLIQNHHTEILDREKNNDSFIHLYSIGTYWVAFERSACILNGIFPKCEITLFRVPNYVEYVVMVSVPADEFGAYYLCKYIVRRNDLDYKVLVVSSFLMEHYSKWHMNAVNSILQGG